MRRATVIAPMRRTVLLLAIFSGCFADHEPVMDGADDTGQEDTGSGSESSSSGGAGDASSSTTSGDGTGGATDGTTGSFETTDVGTDVGTGASTDDTGSDTGSSVVPCDPVAPECPSTKACVPDGDQWVCTPNKSGGGENGKFASPCTEHDQCNAGLFCAPSHTVPGCTGSKSCCSNYCDITMPWTHQYACEGYPQGQECFPWYDGDAPAGFEHVGRCAIP